ncbi:MAG TPA: RNA polymerase sigma factor [Steroidobacteraceae bacterium]|nr:RNA polymerase sigma factor [Steroidobacteraceae bacterium]
MASGRSKGESTSAQPIQAAYGRYAVALSRYLVRRVRRPEDVDDLTQEIFELFVKRKDRAQVVRNPLAYLFRIAFHVVGTALADEGRQGAVIDRNRTLTEAELEALGSSHEDAEALVVQRDVHKALEQLPASYLTALLLIEGQGMSYKEAARITGFTPGTIATYVTHGRAALKLALEGRGKGASRDSGGNGP